MHSRPPPSIIVAVATVAGVTVIAIAHEVWAVFRSVTGRPVLHSDPSILALLGIAGAGVFVVRGLRRRRSIRRPAIFGALFLAGVLAILTVAVAVTPGVNDRPWAVATIGTFTLLAAVVGFSLLRPSAREWLNQ